MKEEKEFLFISNAYSSLIENRRINKYNYANNYFNYSRKRST